MIIFVLSENIIIRKTTSEKKRISELIQGDAEMIVSDSVGPFKIAAFASAVSLAREGAKQIFTFYKEMMERKHSVDVLPQTL